MKTLLPVAIAAAVLFVSPAQAQRGDVCTDPLLAAFSALEPGQVVKEFEGENDALSWAVQVVFLSLEEEDCDNWLATLEVLWLIDFKGQLDDVVIDHSGTLLVEKDEGQYSSSFFASNETEGEGDLGSLHLEYQAAYEVSAFMPFELAIDEDGKPAFVPGPIDLAVHVEVAGHATESIDDRYVALEGDLAAVADLSLRLEPQGDGAFAYEGELAYAWAFDVDGYVQAGKFRRDVHQHREKSGSVPLAGQTSAAEIQAALAKLAAEVKALLASLE